MTHTLLSTRSRRAARGAAQCCTWLTVARSYHKVATVYARGGEVELALQVFNQGLKINPKDEQIAIELDLIRKQKIKEALDGKVRANTHTHARTCITLAH